ALKVDISALHIRVDQLHTEPVADVHAAKTANQSSSMGGCRRRTHVPLSEAPVTMPSNRSPILDSSSMAAADFPTCRSTFFAASSSSVQCCASAANSSFS